MKEEFSESLMALPDEKVEVMACKVRDSGGKMHYLEKKALEEQAGEDMRSLE